MHSYLIVEDSPMVQKIIQHVVQQENLDNVYFADSMATGLALYERHKDTLLACIIDRNLPDAPDGEMVSAMLSHGVPTIVLTGSAGEELRQQLLSMGVADYVLKENRFSYQYAVRTLKRLTRNRSIKALVVDDSSTARQAVSQYLALYQFQVVEAASADEGLHQLGKHDDIKLVIIDYNMPGKNGIQFVQQVRHDFDKRPLAIIGLSGQTEHQLSVRFIKTGANDYLQKPFAQEEFICRVTNTVDALEQMIELDQRATRDYLTHLYNRRYFMEEGELLVDKCRRSQTPLTLALLDIDYFKQINDEYGHEAGDRVLIQLAEYLTSVFERFTLARIGGEEFAIIFSGLDECRTLALLDQFRSYLANQIFMVTEDEYIRVTFSAGVTQQTDLDSLDRVMARADKALYAAKDAGSDMVMTDTIEDSSI